MRAVPLAFAFALASAFVVLPAGPASASCAVPHDSPTLTVQSVTSGKATSGGGLTVGVPAVAPRVPSGTFYVVLDANVVFVYEETNGYTGLQRSDFARDDTCGGQVMADVNIF